MEYEIERVWNMFHFFLTIFFKFFMKVFSKADLVLNKFSHESSLKTSSIIIKSFLKPNTDWKSRLKTDFNCQFHLQVFLQALFSEIAIDSVKVLEMWLLSDEHLVTEESYNSYITQFFSVLPAIFSDSIQSRKDANDIIYEFVKKIYERAQEENTKFSEETWIKTLTACLTILADQNCVMRHREKFAQLFSDYFLSSQINSKDSSNLIADFTNSCFSPGSSSVFNAWKSLIKKTVDIFFTFPENKEYRTFIVTTLTLLIEKTKKTTSSEALSKDENIYRQFQEYVIQAIKDKLFINQTNIYQQSFSLDPIFSIFADFIFIDSFSSSFSELKHISGIFWLISNGTFSETSKWKKPCLNYLKWLIKYKDPRFFFAFLNNCSDILIYTPNDFSKEILNEIEARALTIQIDNHIGDWTHCFTNLLSNPNQYKNIISRLSSSIPTFSEYQNNIFLQKMLYFILCESTELFNKLFMFFEDKFNEWDKQVDSTHITKYILLLGVSSCCGLCFDKSPFRKTILEGLLRIAKLSTDALIAVCITCLELSRNFQKFFSLPEFLTCFINILKEKEIEYKDSEIGTFFSYVKKFMKFNPTVNKSIEAKITKDMKPNSHLSFGNKSIFSFYDVEKSEANESHKEKEHQEPIKTQEENSEQGKTKGKPEAKIVEGDRMIILSRTCSGITLFNVSEFVSEIKEMSEIGMKDSILKKDQLELEKVTKPFKLFEFQETKTLNSKALRFLNAFSAIHEVKQIKNADFTEFDKLCSKLQYSVSFVQLSQDSPNFLITDNENTQEFIQFKEKCFDIFHSTSFINFNLVPHIDDSSICTIVYSKEKPNFNLIIPQLNNKHVIYVVPFGNYYTVITRNISLLEVNGSDISATRLLSPQNTARFLTIYSFLLLTIPSSYFNSYDGILKPRFAKDFVTQCNKRQSILNSLIGDSPKDIFEECEYLFI